MTGAEKRAEIERIYRTELNSFIGLSYNFLHNWSEAEDVVQKAAGLAWEKVERLKSDKNLRAWFYTIVTNCTINQYRKNKRTPTHCAFEAVEYCEHEQTRTPKEFKNLDFNREFCDEVLESLNELDQIHREVIILVDLAEMQYKEAAKIIGKPEGTIMSRLFRARKKLRNKLELKGVVY